MEHLNGKKLNNSFDEKIGRFKKRRIKKMTEEEYAKFCARNLESFWKKEEILMNNRSKSEYISYYARIKLPNRKSILFTNQNGKYFFRTKNSLMAQIYSNLFDENRVSWPNSEKDKERFAREYVEVFKIKLAVYEKD